MQTIQITGMSCGHCVRAVEEALSDVEGVTVHRVEIGEADVTVDASKVSSEQIAAALDEEGFALVR